MAEKEPFLVIEIIHVGLWCYAEASKEREEHEAVLYQREEEFFRIESAMEKQFVSNPLLTGSTLGQAQETSTPGPLSPVSVATPTSVQSNGSTATTGKKKGAGGRPAKGDGRGRAKKGPASDTLLELPPARLPNMFFFRQVLRSALATPEEGGPTQVSPQVLFVMEAAVKVSTNPRAVVL